MRLFELSQKQLPDVLSLISAEDKVLLRQDAVYLMASDQLKNLACPVYCLALDAAVRGILISEPFTALSDNQWLDLVIQAKQRL